MHFFVHMEQLEVYLKPLMGCWRCAVARPLQAHDEQQRNTSHEVLQQCQLLSWFVFMSRCCFNLGRDWCILHRGADLPRDAINLFPSTDMSGLIQHRHTTNNALFNAFFLFSIFYWPGLLKKKKSICTTLIFRGEGTGEQDYRCSMPKWKICNIICHGSSNDWPIFFFQKLCLY